MMEGPNPSPPLTSSDSTGKKRKRSNDQISHTRTLAACEHCRISKTRCDSARPVCSKCAKRGVSCVYPDKDPSSIFEVWATKILAAIDSQGRVLSDLAQNSKDGLRQQPSPHPSQFSVIEEDDLEAMSRKDIPWTPITGSDMILSWSVFPAEKPVDTFPAAAYVEKPHMLVLENTNPSPSRLFELRDIYMTKIQPKNPIIDADQLETYISDALENGFDWSASSCLVLLVFALAAIWGNYPDDERRLVEPHEQSDPYSDRYITMAVPEHRLRESLTYFTMAQKRMSAAHLDASLLGVVCFCFFGMWHQYNIEPIQGWKMFRTASMLWESYNLKHAHGKTQRSKQEESLEQRLYWTCLKSECEIRHELVDLPSCTLQESSFPYSLPTFPMIDSFDQTREDIMSQESPGFKASAEASYYFYLAEISLRRLLNRTRTAATLLSPSITSQTASRLADTLQNLEEQLQQWLECLPPALRFNLPPDSFPAHDESELVKLVRERYVEVREILCRAYLYMCLHGGSRLLPSQIESFGARASAGLRLSVYRIQTEVPFFRHPGSWGACRVRFNHALCLIAAHRGKDRNMESAAWVVVPPLWRECVSMVQDRLQAWSHEGAGISEMCIILDWLVKSTN